LGRKSITLSRSDKQKAAVAFLTQHAFQVAPVLINGDILERLGPNGAADRILTSQRSILSTLLSERRIKRMAELCARNGESVYAPSALVADLHEGIWAEVDKNPIDVELYRRNLQRLWVDVLSNAVDNPATDSDLAALARAELNRLQDEIKGAIVKEGVEVTPAARMHLDEIRARIEMALDNIPSARAPSAAPAPTRRGAPGPDDEG
jgi:hypothetical protein